MTILQKASNLSSLNSSEKKWTTEKIREITQHAAWHGNVSELESEQYLSGQVPFTFLLRSGRDSHHYFISFVTPQLSVAHIPLSIEFSLKGWFYRNGTGWIRENLHELILCALHCEAGECKPLKQLKVDFHF